MLLKQVGIGMGPFPLLHTSSCPRPRSMAPATQFFHLFFLLFQGFPYANFKRFSIVGQLPEEEFSGWDEDF